MDSDFCGEHHVACAHRLQVGEGRTSKGERVSRGGESGSLLAHGNGCAVETLLWMCMFASEGETCLRYCQEHAEIFLMNNELLIRTLNQLVRHGPKATQTHLT